MKYLPLLLPALLLLSCGTESTPIYNLTTSVTGEGTVSPSSGEFEEGETVSLTATPAQGWAFARWEGDWSSTANPSTIIMNSDKTVVAIFERKDYPLNIAVEGEGTVQERIVSQAKATDYPFETVVELTAVAEQGWKFVEWTGDLAGTDNPKQITITQEKSVTATFNEIAYLAENGVTIMCPNGSVGEIGIVNGVEYEVVDRNRLIQRRDEGKDLTKVCTSLVTNMSGMFSGKNFNQPIGNWDVSNVTDMTHMFNDTPFNQPIGDWDVGNVTNMRIMFNSTPFNQPIGNWNVSNVTNMEFMFDQASFNQPIGNWNVSSVRNMRYMFNKSTFNQPIGDWDVSSVRDMSNIFNETPFNHPIGSWDVSNVRDMSAMFNETPFNQPIGDWNVGNVTTMWLMFRSSPFNQPIGDWNVSNVTSMYEMFQFGSFNQPIGNWNVSSARDMRYMFDRNRQFNQDISGWCVSQIPEKPLDFDRDTPQWVLPKPIWGTCPD